MDSLIRFISLFALGAAFAVTAPAAADQPGSNGYGGSTGYGFDVPHDGYRREGQTSATPDATTYVVIEAEGGTTEVVDGETVIVVQEPEPLAATEQAPPAPKTVVVVQPEVQCPGAIWVDGYWAYKQWRLPLGRRALRRRARANYDVRYSRAGIITQRVVVRAGLLSDRGVSMWASATTGPWHWYPPYHHP